MESQIRRVAERDDWRDTRFADPEAEVEDGDSRISAFAWRHSLRREPSLARVLINSAAPLMLLHGPPGSGKTVALRHVAVTMLRRLHDASRVAALPVYINLRDLRPGEAGVGATAIRRYILEQLNLTGARDVEQFLDEEFDIRLRNGGWIFLFDSFDEIPEILRDGWGYEASVHRYADAIYDFMNAKNMCRAVIASRDFKGPERFDVPRVRILQLDRGGQLDLVRRADLPAGQQRMLSDQIILGGDHHLAGLHSNPLFLSLLCEYVRDTGHLPSTAHGLIGAYVDARLARAWDAPLDEARQAGMELAWQMAQRGTLFLPIDEVQRLLSSLDDQATTGGRTLEALDDAGITTATDMDGLKLGFAHRRMQEYFLASAVIDDQRSVSVEELVSSPQWREIVVTLLQTREEPEMGPVIKELTSLLETDSEQIAQATQVDDQPRPHLPWPERTAYLMAVAAEGLGRRADATGTDVVTLRDLIGRTLGGIWVAGRRHDRARSLHLLGGADPTTISTLVTEGFSSSSDILMGAAFAQADRVEQPTEAIATHIRKSLVGKACGSGFFADRVTWRARIRRMAHPGSLLRALNLLLAIPIIDTAAAFLVVGLWWFMQRPGAMAVVLGFAAAFAAPFSIPPVKRSRWLSSAPSASRFSRLWDGLGALMGHGAAMVVLSLAVRATLPATLVGLAESQAQPLDPLVVAGLTFVVFWPYSAMIAISRGLPVSAWYWWSLPVLVPLHLTFRALTTPRRPRPGSDRLVAALLLVMIGVMALFGLAMMWGALLAIGAITKAAVYTSADRMLVGSLVVATVIAGVILVGLLRASARIVSTRHHVARLLRRRQIDSATVEEALRGPHGTDVTTGLVRAVLSTSLTIDETGIRRLADYAADAEFCRDPGHRRTTRQALRQGNPPAGNGYLDITAHGGGVNDRALDDVALLCMEHQRSGTAGLR